MSEAKPPPPNADALASQLKASLSQRRVRPWKVILAALGLSTLLLGLLAYWLYPRVPLAPLQLMAFDELVTADDTPRVRAQLLAPANETAPRRLDGHTIFFHEPRHLLKPDHEPRRVAAVTDARGQADVDWPVGKVSLTEFLVNYSDADKRQIVADRGRVFVWPKEAPILIVDAEETLLAEEVEAKASAALMQAKKEGWHVVYLALSGDHELRTVSAWLARQQAKVPLGPTLGRGHFAGGDPRRDALRSLKSRFTGAMVAIVKSAAATQTCKDVGVRSVPVGKDWADVSARLK